MARHDGLVHADLTPQDKSGKVGPIAAVCEVS